MLVELLVTKTADAINRAATRETNQPTNERDSIDWTKNTKE